VSVEFRQGRGRLVLAALTISTIGDEITLLTLMFRTVENASGYAVPTLLMAALLPGQIAAPWAGRLIDRREAARILVMVSVVQAGVIAFIAYYPMFTLAGATLLSVLFTISSAALRTVGGHSPLRPPNDVLALAKADPGRHCYQHHSWSV